MNTSSGIALGSQELPPARLWPLELGQSTSHDSDWLLRGYKDHLSYLHCRQHWRVIPVPELPAGSAEASAATASQFSSSLCPFVLLSLPYRCCSWEHSPKIVCNANLHFWVYFTRRCNLKNSYQERLSDSQVAWAYFPDRRYRSLWSKPLFGEESPR